MGSRAEPLVPLARGFEAFEGVTAILERYLYHDGSYRSSSSSGVYLFSCTLCDSIEYYISTLKFNSYNADANGTLNA